MEAGEDAAWTAATPTRFSANASGPTTWLRLRTRDMSETPLQDVQRDLISCKMLLQHDTSCIGTGHESQTEVTARKTTEFRKMRRLGWRAA